MSEVRLLRAENDRLRRRCAILEKKLRTVVATLVPLLDETPPAKGRRIGAADGSLSGGLDAPVEALLLRPKQTALLRELGFRTMRDIKTRGTSEIESRKGLGPTALRVIRLQLAKL